MKRRASDTWLCVRRDMRVQKALKRKKYKTECRGKLEGRRTGGTISRIWEIIREESWSRKEEGMGHKCDPNITSPLPAVLITSCINLQLGQMFFFRNKTNIRLFLKTCRALNKGQATEQDTALCSSFQCTAQRKCSCCMTCVLVYPPTTTIPHPGQQSSRVLPLDDSTCQPHAGVCR